MLPEDNQQGEIADSAGELGFFSPHSWWPLPVGLSIAAIGTGIIIGWWLVLMAVGTLVISIIVQVITGIIDISAFFVNVPATYSIIRQLLIILN